MFINLAVNYPTYTQKLTYDNMQKVVKIVEKVEEVEKITSKKYDALGNVIESTDPRGLITKYTYNPFNNLIKKETFVNFVPSVVSYEYDAFGNLISQTDILGNTTTFEYDLNNNLTKQTNPYGQSTVYTYDKLNRPLTVTNPFNKQTTFAYNEAGNVAKQEIYNGEELAKTVTMTYDKNGNLLTTDDGSAKVVNTYDALNLLVKSVSLVDENEFTTSNSYFSNGLIKSTTSPNGGQTEFAYDNLGRPTKVTVADGTYYQTEYGVWGATVQIDRAGRRTEISYNGFGQQTKVVKPDGSVIQYEYNPAGDLTKLVDSNGNTTQWDYDSRGLVTGKTFANDTSYQYNYNDLGQLIKRTDAMEKQTSFAYNQFGQLAKVDYPNDPDVTFTYNSIGQRTGMIDAVGQTQWLYNSSGLPESETDTFGDVVSYEYDALGRKTQSTINQQLLTNYFYDPLGRISEVGTNSNNTYKYDYHYLTNQVTSINRNNQEVVGKTYDILNRLTSLTNKHLNGDIISKYDYTLNNADLRTKINSTNNQLNESTKEFSYNLVNELVAAKKYSIENNIKTYDSSYKYSYTFDFMGNRVSANLVDEPLSYDSNNLNQYTQIFNPNGTADELTYDTNGNLTGIQATSYSYNDENRLSTVVEGVSPLTPFGETKIENIYDGLGRRRIKRVSNFNENQWHLQTETHYTYDGWNTIKETKLNSKLEILNSKLFFWGLDLSGTLQGAGGVGGLLELTVNDQQTTNNYFPSYDGNGNITSYTDNERNIIFSCDYSPFGTVINSEGDAPCDYLFSTKPLDTETGLYYYGYRFYSSSLGRWLTRDPVGEMGGINIYAFINNDSVNAIDFLGLINTRDVATFIVACGIFTLDSQGVLGATYKGERFYKKTTKIYRSYYRVTENCECKDGEWSWVETQRHKVILHHLTIAEYYKYLYGGVYNLQKRVDNDISLIVNITQKPIIVYYPVVSLIKHEKMVEKYNKKTEITNIDHKGYNMNVSCNANTEIKHRWYFILNDSDKRQLKEVNWSKYKKDKPYKNKIYEAK